MDNLIANAIDALPTGGTLQVSTRLAAARCLSFIVVTVGDSGPGIREADLVRLYDPFWTTINMGAGTGLGLPITCIIVEAHGGFIVIANRPGGGLLAALWFPYQDDEALSQTPCWEAMRCRLGGEDDPDPCPAWPNFGRACWAVVGTLFWRVALAVLPVLECGVHPAHRLAHRGLGLHHHDREAVHEQHEIGPAARPPRPGNCTGS